MRNNPTPTLELRTLNKEFDGTLTWVCAETCRPELKDIDEMFRVLGDLDEVEHFIFDEDLANRKDIGTCIEIVDKFSRNLSLLLQSLGLDTNTTIILSAEEDTPNLVGKTIVDFKLGFDEETHAVVVYCHKLYEDLSHSIYGMERELLITIAHELGHAYTGEILDEDGDVVEAEDNHGVEEQEVEAFGVEWADLVLGGAPDTEIEAAILKFKEDIERLIAAIESGEIDPYERLSRH